MLLPIDRGYMVHDVQGNAWLYTGYRVTTADTHSHCFVRCHPWPGTRARATPMWTYEASKLETLAKKFPDLPKEI